jgi:hypothetical protein
MRPATAQPNGKVPRACRAFPATERRRGRIYPAWGLPDLTGFEDRVGHSKAAAAAQRRDPWSSFGQVAVTTGGERWRRPNVANGLLW